MVGSASRRSWPRSTKVSRMSCCTRSKRSQSIPRRAANPGVACRSRHVLSLVNQEAVTDQRCPSARTNSTATKLAIATQGWPPPTLLFPPPSQGILVVVTGNFLHEHHDPAPQGGIIDSHERTDQP